MQTFLLLAVSSNDFTVAPVSNLWFYCWHKVLLNINLVVHSTPQFFGQSFSSSSVVNPNGQVVSQSVYVDSEGNRVVNGMKVPANAPFLSPIDALIPPPLPGFQYNQQQYQPFNQQRTTTVPAKKPATQAPTKKPVTSPTKKPVATVTTRKPVATVTTKKPVTAAPAKKPATTKKPITAKPTRPATSRPSGQKAPLNINGWPTDGSYIHDNSGAYVPDTRGLYRGQ